MSNSERRGFWVMKGMAAIAKQHLSRAALAERVETSDGWVSQIELAGSAALMQGGIAVGLLASGLLSAAVGPSGAFAVAGAAAAIAALILLLGLAIGAEPLNPTPSRPRPPRSRAARREREPDGVPLPQEGARPAPASQGRAAEAVAAI